MSSNAKTNGPGSFKNLGKTGKPRKSPFRPLKVTFWGWTWLKTGAPHILPIIRSHESPAEGPFIDLLICSFIYDKPRVTCRRESTPPMEARVSWFFRLPCSRMDSSSLTYCLVESNSLGLMRPMIHFSSFVLPTTCAQATGGQNRGVPCAIISVFNIKFIILKY